MALMLTRRIDERVILTVQPSPVPQVISVQLCGIKGSKARLGVTADRDRVKVLREEVVDEADEKGGAP